MAKPDLRGVTPEFTRALNARDIMSGIIPTISQPEETPYCIWYPEVPKEDTLRALVQRYPDMLYYAAGACAIAGYIDLYEELDPLPEKRTVYIAGRRAASLNGDTAAYSSLSARSKYYGPREVKSDSRSWDRFYTDPYYFNITEDWGIYDHDCKGPKAPEDYLPLVYSPLPADFPLINKDKLIHVAAYNGDIDRYARL
ncbi:unnamed protein product [Penicillium palitans]